MANFIASPGDFLRGSIKVPGDKSISHRSIMLGSIANGVTNVSGFLEGEDSLATLNAFKDMGVKIEREGSNVVINGVGNEWLKTLFKATKFRQFRYLNTTNDRTFKCTNFRFYSLW
jgi:5-enolpyruvylshikimate-3-phosphate synthase